MTEKTSKHKASYCNEDWIMESDQITPVTKLVYSVLRTKSKDFTGYSISVITNSRIMGYTGVKDPKTIKKAITSLVEIGAVKENKKGYWVAHFATAPKASDFIDSVEPETPKAAFSDEELLTNPFRPCFSAAEVQAVINANSGMLFKDFKKFQKMSDGTDAAATLFKFRDVMNSAGLKDDEPIKKAWGK